MKHHLLWAGIGLVIVWYLFIRKDEQRVMWLPTLNLNAKANPVVPLGAPAGTYDNGLRP